MAIYEGRDAGSMQVNKESEQSLIERTLEEVVQALQHDFQSVGWAVSRVVSI